MQLRLTEDPVLPISAWVFPSIMADIPRQELPNYVTAKFSYLALVDPSFTSLSPIDVLLGADIFASIIDGKRDVVGKTFSRLWVSFRLDPIEPVPPFPVNNFVIVAVS